MPIPDNILPDYEKRAAEALQKSAEEVEHQLQVLNAVMRARRLNKCRSNDCIGCGNSDCIEAEKEYQKLWPEKVEDWNLERASVAGTRSCNTPELASKQGAESEKLAAPIESERRGGDAGGISGSMRGLFDENTCGL